MSLFGSKSSLLTLRPRLSREGSILHINSSRRQVAIDLSRRNILIRKRKFFGGWEETLLHVDELSHLDYGYKSHGTSWGMSFAGFGRQDEVEWFTISVVTESRETHELCSFFGEGAVFTGWSGVLLGDDSSWDVSGTQEEESRSFINELKHLLDLPLGKPIEQMVDCVPCPECGRNVAIYAPKCIYCGKVFKDPESS